MNEEYKEPLDCEGQEKEVDLKEIFAKLVRKWKFIFVVCFIFGVLGIVSALMMEREYTVTLTLAPEYQQGTSSAFSGIASMMGMRMNSNTNRDAVNITFFPQICQSNPFLLQLLPVEVNSFVSKEDEQEGVVSKHTTVFRHLTKADEPLKRKKQIKALEEYNALYDDSVIDPVNPTPKQRDVVKYLKKNISSSVDDQTAMTTITVKFNDPLMAAQLADTVCRKLQEYIIEYRTKKSQDDFAYFEKLSQESYNKRDTALINYGRSIDNNRNVVLQTVTLERERLHQEVQLANEIYTQMVQQREAARAKIQETKPVFAVIQPASVPEVPSNSRKTRVLIFGFLGFFLSCGWAAFGEDIFKWIKEGIKANV